MWLIIFVLLIVIAFAVAIYFLLLRKRTNQREDFIDAFQFPTRLSEQLLKTYPHLKPYQAENIIEGLRAYFHLCRLTNRKMVAMPSQAVDMAWHEFILFTKAYQQFCHQAFGYFLHHTPAEAMQDKHSAQEGIQTAWTAACKRESINAHKPTRLPLIFAIDALYQIPDGFYYQIDCTQPNSANKGFCATNITNTDCSNSGSSFFDINRHSGPDSGCSGCGGCGGD